MGRICRSHERGRARGFTLVELLVVISLLSLVMLAMASALRTTAQTEERVDARLRKVDDLRTTDGFLRAVLGRVSMRKRLGVIPVNESPYYFLGGPQEMVWVGIMPARYGVGGRFFLRLGLEEGPVGQSLVLRYLPFSNAVAVPDWSQAESYVLVPAVTGLELRYEDPSQEPPQWGAPWTITDRLPQRVSIQIRSATDAWPEIVVAMRALPSSDSSIGGAVFGGSQ
ncbi:prepilin-type N-terminal cleavage/methylation domain-containing protein [Paracidovorax cattleyae]|uniref:General secretion pathway protein J n=1 Tax=Paracidovorax cattleyae TaxID=80868 RepID=A0A1H0N043_9BURK|nr:prepilin-type N-terminal cleavage/methylation domain-containing protein [Paracidovorax cattleyae]AVS75663.1 prepilin-type N-terminal cleavage/methylation domain-containing protein [Paracidovorax cattleyae]MBF9263830.1 prepilin-type N-terminal cleavage/methylation domain-containing protein [Paracidovorax cattleyae]SDO85740.1 general secretion pathway protein J [Paracidovorax cattleyae]